MKYFFIADRVALRVERKLRYTVGGWEDALTEKYEGLTGGDILKLTNVPEWLRSESKKNINWYYYREILDFTDIRTLE